MQGIRFILVALTAVFVSQCGAAEFPISDDKVDLRLLVDNGAAIARILFKSVNTGLDQSKPHADKIVNELAPEARTLVQKAIADARNKINEEDKRITHIFDTLSKALDNIKPIKVCSDKVSPKAKKLALATEKDLANIVTGVQNKYKKEIEDIQLGTEKIIQKARVLFDTKVDAVVKCLTPGKKDSATCLSKELEDTIQKTTALLVEVVLLSQTANDTLAPILPEVIEKLLPLLTNTLKNGQVLLKELGDCVAALK